MMNETATEPNAQEPQHPDDHNTEARQANPYLTTGFILAGIIGFSYLINSGVNHPQWIWADCFGRAFGTGLLSLLSAVAIVGVLMVIDAISVPSGHSRMSVFLRSLAWPLVLTGALWLWHAHTVASTAADDATEVRALADKLRRDEELRSKAEPVIRAVRLSEENSIKNHLRGKDGVNDVIGWSAAHFEGTKWLVKFQFNENDSFKWMIYEYDSYLTTVKSVHSDKRLKEQYLETDETGATGLKRSYLTWYGPVR